MAKQRNRTERESKEERKNQYEILRNQFILFYTLRHLWKMKKRRVNDLYKILFPSYSRIGGNKTLYDRILSLKGDNLLADSKRLAELTGISETYFTGEHKLSGLKVSDDEWKKFIDLRKEKGDSPKSADLVQIEDTIKRAISLTVDDKSNQSEPFKRLLYFAEYGHKRVDKNLIDLFGEIESKISECKPEEFKAVDLELLKEHQKRIQTHLYHIAAVVTLREWEQERNRH